MTLVAAIAGIVGAVAITIGWIVGILGYNSRTDKPFGRRYSPLTHLVSALGHATTPRATIFNVCIVIGAIAVGLVFVGVALLVPDDAIKVVMLIGGIIAAIAGVLVGIFPSGKPREGSVHHLLFAMGFFILSAAVVGTLTAFLLFGSVRGEGIAGGLAIPGILVVLAAALMLIAGLVKIVRDDSDWSVPDLVDNVPQPDPVPRVMLLPVAEWSYVALLNLWTVVISVFLFTRL